MTEREYFSAWCDIQRLVENSLGLAMLVDYDCANCIISDEDQQLARNGAVGAMVVLLRQAIPVLESMDPHRFTFIAPEGEPT
jgi:hypothetical protein